LIPSWEPSSSINRTWEARM